MKLLFVSNLFPNAAEPTCGMHNAQQVAAFITSKPRPVYPHKDRDYVGGKIPADAVYYR